MNAIVEYHDYPLEQKGQKGGGDFQAENRYCSAPPTHDLSIWLCGRQTNISVMGFRVSVENFFWVNR